MLRQLKAWLKGLFVRTPSVQTNKSGPTIDQFHATLGGVDISGLKLTQSQLDKRTHFKPGESFMVGEMRATVHKDKASMLAAIAAVNARREARHKRLTERGIQLMLMKPEELITEQFKDWLAKREAHPKKIRGIMGGLTDKRYIPPKEATPSGLPKERFKQIMEKVKDKEKA